MTRPTPETDAQFANMGAAPDKSYVRAEFARKLERERDEAREAQAYLAKYLDGALKMWKSYSEDACEDLEMDSGPEPSMYRAAIKILKRYGPEARSREGGGL